MFGAGTPIFGSSTINVSSEPTTNNSPLFATNATTTGPFGPFERTKESPFGISNPVTTNIFEVKAPTSQENEPQKDNGINFLPTTDISFSTLAAKAPQHSFKAGTLFLTKSFIDIKSLWLKNYSIRANIL